MPQNSETLPSSYTDLYLNLSQMLKTVYLNAINYNAIKHLVFFELKKHNHITRERKTLGRKKI